MVNINTVAFKGPSEIKLALSSVEFEDWNLILCF